MAKYIEREISAHEIDCKINELKERFSQLFDEDDVENLTQLSMNLGKLFAKRDLDKKLDGFVLVPVEPTYEMRSELSRHLGRYMQSHDRYCPKTLKKYFDRFIGEPPEWLTKEVKDWDSEHAFATADLPVFIYKAMIEACNN